MLASSCVVLHFTPSAVRNKNPIEFFLVEVEMHYLVAVLPLSSVVQLSISTAAKATGMSMAAVGSIMIKRVFFHSIISCNYWFVSEFYAKYLFIHNELMKRL